MDEDYFESILHVEQNFYDSGHKDGFEHGRIHGLIEGRALGREKGFEMWEELGFYEGFALAWNAIYTAQSRDDDRVMRHIKSLLELISQFPRVNPSATDSASEMDIPKLFRQIQSRYKVLCSTLGVQPSLRAAAGKNTDGQQVEGDSQGKKTPVWKLENSATQRPITGQDLSF